MTAIERLRAARVVFWDFDGVIKDSVEVKTDAYVALFAPFGAAVAEKIKLHHQANGGMSRFDKLPIYLEWAGQEPNERTITEFCNRFSDLVLQAVVDSCWVPGVERYLHGNPNAQSFVVVSATPQDELEQILQALDLTTCFNDVFGAPTGKSEAIRTTLADNGIGAGDCVMIGDALADLDAAQANGVPFVLRRHPTNAAVFADYSGPTLMEFTRL